MMRQRAGESLPCSIESNRDRVRSYSKELRNLSGSELLPRDEAQELLIILAKAGERYGRRTGLAEGKDWLR